MSPSRPTKAFILAAGQGTRMRPLSRSVPKPLMPLWGRPLLEHTLTLLRSWGVRDVLINAHYRAADLLCFVLTHEAMGLRLQISYEPEILGTGGALRKAAWFLDQNPFWLINADVAADLDPDELLAAYRRHRPLAVLWLHPERGPRTVVLRRGRIVSFRGDPSDRSDPSDLHCTFCGLHLLSPRILSYLPESGFAGIIQAYEKALAAGERILGRCVKDSYWADVGSPEAYLEAHRETLACRRAGRRGGRFCPAAAMRDMAGWRSRGVRIRGFAAVGQDVRIARGAALENAVIWEGARIHPGAGVRHAIVGAGTEVYRPVSHVALRGDDALDFHERSAVNALGWEPGACTVEAFKARGSGRAFFRVHARSTTVLLVRYDRSRAENALYAGHARFLDSLGLPVPKIFLHDPARGLLLMEDLGHISLSDIAGTLSEAALRRVYRRVLDHVIVLHSRGGPCARRRRLALMKPFGPALYRWEHEYFITHYLRGYAHLSPAKIPGIRRDLRRVARRLSRAPKVLIHRDLQSSNILVRGGKPHFVDFQGLRFGAAAYDLASLMCDPYVMLPEPVQLRLLRYYMRRTGRPEVEGLFWWAAVQRLVQALGAYARLGRLPGAERFLSHIPPALAMLERALRHVGPLPHLEALGLPRTAGGTR